MKTDVAPSAEDVKQNEDDIRNSIERIRQEEKREADALERACPSTPRELIDLWEREREEWLGKLTPLANRLMARGWHHKADKQIREALSRHLGKHCEEYPEENAEILLDELREIWQSQRGTVLQQPTGHAEAEAAEAENWLLGQAERQAAVTRIRRRRETRRHNEEAARAAHHRAQKAQTAAAARLRNNAPRARARRSPASHRGTTGRSSSGGNDGSGSTGGSDDPDPEPQQHDVYNYQRLAARWSVSARSLANRFAAARHTLPPHIHLPGVRGPRWLREDVEEFERSQRRLPEAPRRGRGRPRIIDQGGRP